MAFLLKEKYVLFSLFLVDILFIFNFLFFCIIEYMALNLKGFLAYPIRRGIMDLKTRYTSYKSNQQKVDGQITPTQKPKAGSCNQGVPFRRKTLWKQIMASSMTPMLLSTTAVFSAQTVAQGVVEEVISIGTRSTEPRTAADSTVPVDVFNAEDISRIGGTADITDNLNTLIPSYLAAPATGDGSAFVRPTSLRGLASDQTLVLINGSRRHRSSLVQLFAPAANNGSHVRLRASSTLH